MTVPGTAGPPADADPAPAGAASRAAAAAQVFVGDPAVPVLAPGDLHHLSTVLRLRPGEPVVAADGAGRWTRCAFTGSGGDAGALEVLGPPVLEERPVPTVTVAFTPAKGDRPEWVVQKLTELGVDTIVPLHAARSVVRWSGERQGKALARLRRVAREAASQSRRVWLPDVTEVRTLGALGPPTAGAPPVALAQPGAPPPTRADQVVAVGPEGGWSAEELAAGRSTVGLGPAVLRAETAAVAFGVLLTAVRDGIVTVRPAGAVTG